MKHSLIAVDLDGTLLRNDGTLARRTARALSCASERGVKVVLSSGRMIRAVKPFHELAGLNTPIIGYNGAFIFNPSTEETLFHRPLERVDSDEVINFARKNQFHINAYSRDLCFSETADEFAQAYSGRYRVPVHLVKNLREIEGEMTKLIVMSSSERFPVAWKVSSEAFGGRLYVTCSQNNYVEIMHPEVNKGMAVSLVACRYGIPREEVVAIGDAPNDLEMFESAGLKVAVANADERVKKVADLVIPSNEEDGVASFVERML